MENLKTSKKFFNEIFFLFIEIFWGQSTESNDVVVSVFVGFPFSVSIHWSAIPV